MDTGISCEEIPLHSFDSDRPSVSSLVSAIHEAIDKVDLKTLGSLADQWRTLRGPAAVPIEEWKQILLADPLARAVRHNKIAAIHFLISDKQMRIQSPCARTCRCRLCSVFESDYRFHQLYSQRVLGALCSSHYIIHAWPEDPIGGALEVWHAIRHSPLFTSNDVEKLRNELHSRLELSIIRCLSTAVSEREVEALLASETDYEAKMPLPMEKLGQLLAAEMHKAVAHSAVQALLRRSWHRDGHIFRVQVDMLPMPVRLCFNLFVYFVLTPLGLFFPHPRLVQFIRSPSVVYTNEAIAYWVFLFFIAFTFFKKSDDVHYIICDKNIALHHHLLAVVIVSRLCRTCNGLWHFGRSFFTSPYELIQCVSSVLYGAGMSMLIIAHYVVPSKQNVREICVKLAMRMTPNVSASEALEKMLSKPVTQCEAARAFYSLGPEYINFVNDAIEPHNVAALCFAIGHLFYFLSAGKVLYMNRLVGHLNVAVTHMIKDVIRWGLLMTLFFFAWALAMVSLYTNYSCENKVFSTMKTSMLEMFWVLFAMTGTRDYKMHGVLKRLDHPATDVIEYTGFALYGSYYFLAQIVLVNLLIALMSVTFQKIDDDRQVTLAFWRSKIQVMFIKWHMYSIFPSPYNILTPLHRLSLKLFTCVCRKQKSHRITHYVADPHERAALFQDMLCRKLQD